MVFSFEHYRSLLKILNNTFAFSHFKNYSKNNKVFLRHDVDIFLENTLNLAFVESELCIRSTYLFQPNCEFYNLLSPSTLRIIDKLHDLGHWIGLHIDASGFSEHQELEEYINANYDYFVKFIPLEKIISFHKPGKFVLDDLTIPDFINVYQKKYFKDIRYFSDSARRDFSENLLNDLELDKNTSIQLLIHPYWWDHINLDLWELWNRYLKIKQINLESVLKSEFKPYRNFFDYRFDGINGCIPDKPNKPQKGT